MINQKGNHRNIEIMILRYTTSIVSLFVSLPCLSIIDSYTLKGSSSFLDIIEIIVYATILIGFIIVWEWEKIGGILIIGGSTLAVILSSLGYLKSYTRYFEIFYIVLGSLFLLYWYLENRGKNNVSDYVKEN